MAEDSPSPVRVFLVDDHRVVREGTRMLLETADGIEVVGTAATAGQALLGVSRLLPDVALVDIRLPDRSGVQVIRDIRSRHPQVACVVFTSFADDEALLNAVMAGAAGYLVKDADVAELVDAVRVVAAGGSLIRPEVVDNLNRRARGGPPGDRLLADLSPQERRVLHLVTQGYTNQQVADELSLAEKTVRNYVSGILAKVGMHNRTQLAAYVVSHRR